MRNNTTLPLFLLLVVGLLVSVGGCGGPTGGSITENADQTAIDAYRAETAKPQTDPDPSVGNDDPNQNE